MNLWTWGGTYFGRRKNDDLWTHDGRHVGKFHGDEIFAPDGRYLGEIRAGKRLITMASKKGRRKGGFSPKGSVVGHVPYVDYVGNVMIVGYEDFPGPTQL